MSEASVYVVGGGRGGVKVGSARDVRRRLSALQTGAGRPLRVLHEVRMPESEARAVEGHTHWLLDPTCRHGEWFAVSAKRAREAVAAAIIAAREGRAERVQGKVGRPRMHVVETKVRLLPSVRDRIVALAGENRMAAFIRDAIDEKLARDEKS